MSVILYRYDGSPFGAKVESMLALKSLPAAHVNVSPILPRPEIFELLGVGYRRIPVLAIGRDLYCDSSLIASVLERRFPPSAGYGTLFPKRKDGGSVDTGLVKALAQFYADSALFPTAVPLLSWDKVPAAFLSDRSKTLVEQQLSDGRQWLFDTETPGLADLAVFFVLDWVRGFPGVGGELFDKVKFGRTVEWLDNLSAHLKGLKASLPKPEKVSGKEAAARIATASVETLAFDDKSRRAFPAFDETAAGLLGVKQGAVVSIVPEDNSRDYPTTGLLVGLNDEEYILEVKGEAGTCLCHFPRMRYAVVSKAAKL
ncbi:hypothetical protein BD626DRAFT_545308 [Schizophyllum amplum]|uniref:GST N-terminal domain-containing protein n=1 Tax=Schizophyllum amplum TaxID=97359 RepID=A0A550CTG6_9AGAR|nr:hypothetical protein BD626DRAFT_545308 [Auriculariopsis ampla]